MSPPGGVRWARRSSQAQQSPVDNHDPSKLPVRHGSFSGQEPRLLVRRNSGDKGTGEWIDVDGEKRSRNRNNSAPPDNRHRHHPADHRPRRPPQGGRAGFIPVSATESWAFAERWVNTWWNPGRNQVQVQAEVQVRGQWAVRGGQLRERQGQRKDVNRGRGRRSNHAVNHPTSTPAPAPRRTSTPPPAADPSPPVIPTRVATTSGGMRLRNLLRKSSHKRRKILFYHKHQPYYGFTNFSPHPVVYRGKRYPTSEHLFQSFKVSGVGPRTVFFG